MKNAGAVIVLAAAVLGLAFVHPWGNPHVELAKGLDTLLQGAAMPSEVKAILIAKCADCHSNETRWPVYARVAPGSWLIERDIVQARRKMNLSNWGQMPADAQELLLAKIVHEVKSGDMPPLQYRVLHWGVKLSAGEVAAITRMSKGAEAEAGEVAPGDPVRGKAVFGKRCTGCHALEGNREGPRLAGVFGRRAGTVPGFEYSAGLRSSRITWDATMLERWLRGPDIVVPDTKMDFYVPRAQERADLIAYFRQ